MKAVQLRPTAVLAALGVLLTPAILPAHVTFQPAQPLRTGVGYANVILNVPNERTVNNTKITLEVPQAFLKAGGRINRVQYPPGWNITLEKQDKPADVVDQEKTQRAKRGNRQSAAAQGAGAEAGAPVDADNSNQQSQEPPESQDEARKKWITKVTFDGGAIPPDGFQQFLISFQLPETAGSYRFSAVQTYADGNEVSWSELIEGADHPAPTLAVIGTPAWLSNSNLSLVLAGLSLAISCAALCLRRRAPRARATAAGAADLTGARRS